MKIDLSVLNDQQREAVLNIDKPTLVIAGAGSGKTTTIVYKIAYMVLEKGFNPDRILALTFTKNAAEEMRKRVRDIIGYDLPWIKTFHAFSLKLLRTYSSYLKSFNIPENFDIADDSYTLMVVRELLDEFGWDADAFEVRSFISYVKRSGEKDVEETIKNFYEGQKDKVRRMFLSRRNPEKSSIEELEEMLRKSGSSIIQRLEEIFNAYNERLRVDGKLDYEDLQIYAVELLRTQPVIRKAIQRRFDHIFIDEYQDTDAVQYQLFKLLVGDRNNPKPFTVVGDPNQAIYTWRNARIENILHLDKEYVGVKVIKLEKNYRSTKRILGNANKIAKEISKDWPDKVIQLWTDKHEGEPVVIEGMAGPDEEAKWVVDKIKELRPKVKSWADFAVLLRTNYLSENIERALYNADIPYVVKGGKRFYEREEIEVLLSYLRFALDPSDKISFTKSVRFPHRRVGTKTLQDIADYYETDWLQATKDYIKDRWHAGLNEYIQSIEDFRDRLKKHPLHIAFTMLIEDTGLYDYINDRYIYTAGNRIAAIEKLLDTIETQGFTPEGLLAFVDKIKKQSKKEEGNAVVVSTIHAAKGLEYDTVFVLSVNEGVLPHKNSLEDPDLTRLKEEWRIFYVAITRPKERLFLTYLNKLPISRFLEYLLRDEKNS